MADRRTIIALTVALIAAVAGCGADAEPDQETPAESTAGVFYGLGDDHRLLRWEVGAEQAEPVLDLGGVWEGEGDVGAVLNASLSVDPTQRHAAWISGGSDDAELMIGDLDTGESRAIVDYPLDHACIEPTWTPDGSSLTVHRAEVWSGADDSGDAIPLPSEDFGAVEQYTPDGELLPGGVDLDEGCRLRWYTADDGFVQGFYHNLEVTEFYRIDQRGDILQTADVSGAEPAVTGLVGVDPSGRYACLADGYGEHETFEGAFTVRPQTGSRIVDLESGKEAGRPGAGCDSLQSDGYIARDDAAVTYIDYEGETIWDTELPAELENTPVLFFFPEAP